MYVADTCLFPVWQVHLPAYTLWQYDQCPVMEPSKPPDHYNILHLSHKPLCISMILAVCVDHLWNQGAVSIRKTVLPGVAIPMLKIRRPNGRLIFNMEIAIRR